MGCGASVARQPNTSRNAPNAGGRPKPDTIMTSFQTENNKPNKNNRVLHVTTRRFIELEPVRCGDILELTSLSVRKYDIFQVYKDGDDYYQVDHGYELFNINMCTPLNERLMRLSLDLTVPEIDFYFCVILSSRRERIVRERKCPAEYCRLNRLTIRKCEEKIALTDLDSNQKVYLNKGDTIELDWSSSQHHTYRIEERKYCPQTGRLYTVGQPSQRPSAGGKYRKTFNELGSSFLFRYTNTNQLRDIIAVIVDNTYKIKHVQITDDEIQPQLINIEENDWIMFDWSTTASQSIVQIEPFRIDECTQQSIELRNAGEHFFWPHGPTRRGLMYHQFKGTGVYCYKTGDRIGTIVVKPRVKIHQIAFFDEKSVYANINTNDFIQFNWKKAKPKHDPIFLTIDRETSVPSDIQNDRTRPFQCHTHKCRNIVPAFSRYFDTCETFLYNIPQYGLYNFTCSKDMNTVLISLIIENAIETHYITYDEYNAFEPNIIKINRCDQVQILPSLTTIASTIFQTNEHGRRTEHGSILFQPQRNSINYFVKHFNDLGVFYFSTNVKNHLRKTIKQTITQPLAVIVIPEIRFHEKRIETKKAFDSKLIVTTNSKDFVIWRFDQPISHNVVQLHQDEKFDDLLACHTRAVVGRKRQCVGFYCEKLSIGAFFFANPDFEKVTGFNETRLISTVIIDPPFSQNSILVTDESFRPNVLYIEQNDTVSWVSKNTEVEHHIVVQSNEDEGEEGLISPTNRKVNGEIKGICHLHTFLQPGTYTVQSNRFGNTTNVVVYSTSVDRENKRISQPAVNETITDISPFDMQVHLKCENDRNADIYYTMDGSIPTRPDNHIRLYDPDDGIRFRRPGFLVLRSYSTEDRKISSFVDNCRPTYVMGDEDVESVWSSCSIKISAVFKDPDKIIGRVGVSPIHSLTFIDYFELYINNILKETIRPSDDGHYSVDNIATTENYEIKTIAHPKASTERAPITATLQINGSKSSRSSPQASAKETRHSSGGEGGKKKVDGVAGGSPKETGEGGGGGGKPEKDDLPKSTQTMSHINRAVELYKALQVAMERRSKMHPHKSYPGTYHYYRKESLSLETLISSAESDAK
ncbi:unnamed protein product [Adineta ricciae]|uniref:Uncharacterized protein n=1 Tax=Adineta ricciae TaxID=249248 RepID=A0A814SXF2_ADIRI|nr:unnamed protein product [Adineta ricciae]